VVGGPEPENQAHIQLLFKHLVDHDVDLLRHWLDGQPVHQVESAAHRLVVDPQLACVLFHRTCLRGIFDLRRVRLLDIE